MNGFSFDRLRMSKALYQRLIDTAVKQFGQMESDNRQKTDSPATIYTMTRADDASFLAITISSVIIDDLDVAGIPAGPAEADPPLVIDADAVLSPPVTC